MEIWKPIKQTRGLIEVSNEGRVRSNLRTNGFVLKTQPDKKGYHRVRITIDREKYSFKVHREVAKAFIPNPGNLPQVNHIDGNKNNNAANNLEWISNKDNANHAIRTGLWDSVFSGAAKCNESRKIPIIAYNDFQQIKFDSVREAEKYFGSRHISDVLKGKRCHVNGWSFIKANGGEVMIDA